ncbi:MAG TPA: NUDIX hydrolase [Flavobacterium sp.]|jgi:8-oxo-dGTP diphosphatase
MRISKIFVTVDAVVIKGAKSAPEILLIKRGNEPFKDHWALPGGFVDENEDLEKAALRELKEETGLVVSTVEQLKAFGKPFRDPRHHTVSVAFLAFADDDVKAEAADDASDAKWFPLNKLPQLAFDHQEIIDFAKTKIT